MTLGEDRNLRRVRLLPSVWDISTNCSLFVKYYLTHLFAEPTYNSGVRGGVVVEALRYKPEGRGFEKKIPDCVTGFFH
jgi:hypothetical protein